MKIFGKKYKMNPDWKFSQNGNLWKFIFAGKNNIAGETRDVEKKILYFFSLDISSGRHHVKNFLFEDGNYWISTEGANDKILFVSRFQSPELPYPKNIIALDLKTGAKLWENEEYIFHFCTDEKLYGIKNSFGKITFAEMNQEDGSARTLSDEEASLLSGMKAKSDEDLYNEYYDYPKSHSSYPAGNAAEEIFRSETGRDIVEGDIEYILRDNYLMFNYYVESGSPAETGRKVYKNIFCVYNHTSGEKLFEDLLSENSNYSVPDNFFIKDGRLYYLKGRSELLSINLQE
ncbi:MAG: DUF4905 domain-containing protein [Bacteroidetes bacterium]|nr:DUF4905 domain-containing protein [Bacteroidota bacterium]